MNSTISLLVADDHHLLLKGLVDELNAAKFNVIATAMQGAEALEKIIKLQPDVALLDIEMPYLSGFEVIQKSIVAGVTTRFIILTSHKEKSFIATSRKHNISGYILKDEPFSEVEICIREVSKGNTYFSKTFDAIVDTEITPEIQKIKLLSPSERTILRLIASEKSTNEIAELVSISPRTVQKHRSNIIGKLEIASQVDGLLQWSLENKEIILSI